MASLEVTVRTKAAVRVWAGFSSTHRVVLDDKLEDLRPGNLSTLRKRVNEEFDGETDFPISTEDWTDLKPKTVRNVRDEARKRRGD